MSFLRFELWWIAPAALAAVVIMRFLLRRRALAFTRVTLLTLSRFRASRLRYLPVGILALAFGAVVLALMEPVIPYSEREVVAEGLDIVLVVDLSLSMYDPIGLQQQTASPGGAALMSRMDATKEALRTFISLRRDDRIGIVVFSDNAYIVSPLTFDREHLLNYFDLMEPKTLWGEGLTGIGEGIAMASILLDRLSPPRVENKVIVVFTDGANTAGRDPIGALSEASSAGVRVHVVAVDLLAEVRRSPAAVELMQAVRLFDGQYYAADSRAELDAASRALDQIEKGSLTTKNYVRNDPLAQTFALAALVLLAVALLLRVAPFFVALH